LSTASKLLAEQYQSVLEEIKPAVSEAVFERLNESIRRHQELLEGLQRENKLLRELRRLELLEKYGPSAETLSDEQLELLELEPGVSSTEVEAESQRALVGSNCQPSCPGKNKSFLALPISVSAVTVVKRRW